MYRKDFIRKVAEKAGFIKADVRLVLDAAGEIAAEVVGNEDNVKLFEGLTLEGIHVDEKNTINHFTKEPMFVEAHTLPKARFSPGFRAKVK